MNWEQIIARLVEMATSLGIKLLAAMFVMAIGWRCIKSFIKWIQTSPKLSKLDSSVRSFLASFSKIGLYSILFITLAMVLGVPATSFITVIASCGVAIGLALQGSLSNFAGGLMILLFKPFKVGDYIEVEGDKGTVKAISVVYTVILTDDNKQITIPNGTLTNSVIENYSAEETRRVDLQFGVAYDSNMEQVKNIIEEIINSHPLALKDPQPFVRLASHDESALTYKVRAWCKTPDYWDLYYDLTESVKLAFDKNNIEIPYPQLDVHINNK